MKTSQSIHKPFHDRFIRTRASTDHLENFGQKELLEDDSETDQEIPQSEPLPDSLQNKLYKALMQSQVLGLRRGFAIPHQEICNENLIFPECTDPKVPSLGTASPALSNSLANCFSLSPVCGLDEDELVYPFHEKRMIPKTPYKVLDAPALQDDYYLDVVHWSKENVLAVGLGKSVYLWVATNSKVTKLYEFEGNDSVSSVAWSPKGDLLAVGSNQGYVQIWDCLASRELLNTQVHNGRVGTMCWSPSSLILSTGSRDTTILHRDIRTDAAPSNVVSRSVGNKQEVCGLRWSPDDQYIASGGNDNKVLVWSKGKFNTPCLKFSEHKAAVKALAWSPHQNGLLATGGGTADRCLKFWNVTEGQAKGSIDTGSQVCNMMWGINSDEIVTTHGYSYNHIAVWRCNPLKRIAQLSGHLSRILYLSMSPDGQAVVTGSGDETLRFWQVFPPNVYQTMQEQDWAVYPSTGNIR